MPSPEIVPHARFRFRCDLVAFGLLLAGLAVALCVFNYNPTDPSFNSVYAADSELDNVVTWVGAALARCLFETLGVAVYVLLAAWFVLVVLLYQRRSWLTWLLRLFGWLLLLPCASVVAKLLGPERLGSLGNSVTGSGGSLGAWLCEWLKTNFDALGQIIVFSSCLSLALFLAIDFAVIRFMVFSWRTARMSLRIVLRARSWVAKLDSGTVLKPRANRAGAKASSVGPPAEREDATIPIRHHLEMIRPAEESEPETPPATLLLPVPTHSSNGDDDEHALAEYELPPLSLLEEPEPFPVEEHDQKLRERAALLEKTFTDFGLSVRVVGINTGPVITQYEVALETGLRVHKVTRLADDLALNLRVPSVRMVAPIPGKNTVGVEIPNEHRAVVRLKEVIQASGKKLTRSHIPLFLGKDTEGRPLVYDLAEMPHLLIAGRTGTGKSVCMNAVILSILMTRRPDEVKMVMIDPKMLELSEYGKIPHLMHPIVKDMKKAEAILAWAVDKMEERYDLLSRARVRNLAGYNELSPEEIHDRVRPADEEERSRIPDRMPYIVIFVDEMGDLMMTMKKEVEGHIIRLAQKSRAAGIHLVVATQKPTVDVITGLIKSNLPARICFQVSSRSDSRVVLDEMGADKLLGKGDMLFLQPGTSTLVRCQGTYASDAEIQRIVESLECEPCYATELIQLKSDQEGTGGLMETLRARDELYEAAVEIVIREGRGSVSLLQRALGIGYGRAARLVDFMAEDGIVGAYNGSSARDVLYTPEQWEQLKSSA
jgi:S-DNA-T family DNA segregation ATPase FtsK/SpoIIIE